MGELSVPGWLVYNHGLVGWPWEDLRMKKMDNSIYEIGSRDDY